MTSDEKVVEPVAAVQLPLNEEVARILEEQVEVIVQRQVYHTQLLFGVSGMGTPPVNARNAVLTIAGALRNNTPDAVTNTLANLGDAQISQINDHTTPHGYNAQAAGLLEGILVDTASQAMKGDPQRQKEGRAMLEQLFIDANEAMGRRGKSSLAFRLEGLNSGKAKQLTGG